MSRPIMMQTSRTPGPAAYNTAHCMDAVKVTIIQYSIGIRRDARTGWYKSPGPARYSAVALERFKRQTPRPVILGRSDKKTPGRRTPAPNAYCPPPGPASRYANAPKFTMGRRLSGPAQPYYTAADKVPNWE